MPFPSRDDALAILTEYTRGDSLRKHALAVEAAMRHYAAALGEDVEAWGVAGLLHDFDYERYPSLDDHPFRGAEILRGLGHDEELIQTILSHADHTGVPRTTRMRQTLFAVDELCGFVTAVTLVRPSKKIDEVEPSSVKKKLKDKAFARNVSRDDITAGAELLGIPLDDHIQNVIAAMRGISGELGL
ncbi:MAG TPA: HDIG domain-containing protein [Candidatus Krumholzibacteria bacterium]|nr:HDIG domain-containing protein [Candidatus Krumholzibacteria bacterium]